MPKLRYVGPFDEVEYNGTKVLRNHQVDVSDADAGRQADERLVPAMEELHKAQTPGPDYNHARAAELRQEIAGLDMGEGMLAQYDNWQLVAAPSKKDGDK